MSFAVVKPNTVTAGTYSRASTGTYFDVNGVMQVAAIDTLRVGYDPATHAFSGVVWEPARTNKFLQSGGADFPAWGKGNVTVTANATLGPDGTVAMDKLVESATNTGHYIEQGITQDANVQMAFACFVKAAERTKVVIQIYDWANTANNINGQIDLLTGAVLTQTAAGTGVLTRIYAQPCGNNIYRLVIVGVPGSNTGSTIRPRISMMNGGALTYLGDGVSGCYVWGGQLEVNTGAYSASFDATSYITTSAAPVTRAADTLPSGMTSDISATDYSAIAGSHAYIIGDRVQESNSVYQCTLGYTSAASPVAASLDPTHWLYFSPTKRWAPFDTSISTQASKATSLSYVIKPDSTVSAVAVLNAADTSVRCRMVDSTGVLVYDSTKSLTGTISLPDYWNYCFETVVQLDQALFLDMPPYGSGSTLLVDVYSASATAKAGVIMLGYQLTFSYGIKYGARGGITDYSRKDTDTWGNTILDQRAFSKRRDWSLDVKNTEIDALERTLISLRAIPCLWVGYSGYSATTVFGFYKDFDINIQYSTMAECTLQLEGMT